MGILIPWLILAASVFITAKLLPGFKVKGIIDSLVVAAIFGVLNWLLGLILFTFIGFVTLGVGFAFAFLTRWLVLTIVLKFTDALTSRLEIRSFGTAVIAAAMMSGLGTLGEYLVKSFQLTGGG